jgi:hypothetical protein
MPSLVTISARTGGDAVATDRVLDPQVLGTEVMAPRGDAVRLVDHQEAGPVLGELVDHLVLGELLRGQEQELRRAGGQRLPGIPAVAVGL